MVDLHQPADVVVIVAGVDHQIGVVVAEHGSPTLI
jgi:hypothetical protein